jgi:hypothetical protein
MDDNDFADLCEALQSKTIETLLCVRLHLCCSLFLSALFVLSSRATFHTRPKVERCAADAGLCMRH